jgi:hypothetical protein
MRPSPKSRADAEVWKITADERTYLRSSFKFLSNIVPNTNI